MSRKLSNGLVAAVLWVSAGAQALPFTSLTVFGDSLSDSGNVFLATGATTMPPVSPPVFPLIPDAPYPRGAGLLPAFTNGPNWAEVLGAGLNLPVIPSILGGTNFAFGGADSGPLPVPPSASPSLFIQLNGPNNPPASPFFGGGPIDPNALYAVWGGNNDIRRALDAALAVLLGGGNDADAFVAASDVINAGVANVGSILEALAAGGAKHILSLNIADVGLAPAIDFAPPGTGALASALSIAFNTGLAPLIGGIESMYAVDIIEVDVFALLHAIVALPASFGLANATDPCLQIGGDGVCANPDEFMFLDGIHPTAAGHRLIGLAAVAAIPSPGTMSLLVFGLTLLALGRRPLGQRTR